MQFEATEENKLVYTTIFKAYTDLIENHIFNNLSQMIEGFNMETFLEQVIQRNNEIDEPLMDLLLSFSEFECFKEMMLFARAHLVATTPKLKSGKAAALGLKNTVSNEPIAEGKKMKQSDMRHYEDCIEGLQISGKATGKSSKDAQNMDFMISGKKL